MAEWKKDELRAIRTIHEAFQNAVADPNRDSREPITDEVVFKALLTWWPKLNDGGEHQHPELADVFPRYDYKRHWKAGRTKRSDYDREGECEMWRKDKGSEYAWTRVDNRWRTLDVGTLLQFLRRLEAVMPEAAGGKKQPPAGTDPE